MTGISDGEGLPSYECEPNVAEVTVEDLNYTMREAYEEGLYCKGSIGEVRAMLHAMDAVSQKDLFYSLRLPNATSDKAQKEAEAFVSSQTSPLSRRPSM